MTKIEANILLNQASIMAALLVLVPEPLSNSLEVRANETIDFVNEFYKEPSNKEPS